LRILGRAGALAIADASRTQAHIRLLATPERIKAELNESTDGLALALLRSLWKRSRGSFHRGIVADLDALPPGLGGPLGAAAQLDALQARQFLVWQRLGEGITLTEAARPLEEWPVDWALLERRRSGELRKLEMVQQYAYTKFCRRAFVLRYFGDPAAKPRCDNCDRCQGIEHLPRTGATESNPRRAEKKPGAGKGVATDAPLSALELARFDALKLMRSNLAKDEEVPAYVIFPDRALRGIAKANPESLAQLASVSGVGPARLDRYGRAVLETLRDVS
jgi:ATP-dependent DNA helicase RecQ